MSWKFISAALLVLFMPFFAAECQKHPQLRYIGIDAGFNMAGIRQASQYDRHEKNTGANINLSSNYSFSDSKSIGASLSFEQKGAVDHIYDVKTNLNYFTLPLYVKWVTGKEPRFFLTAGGYTALLVSANKRGEQLLDGQTVTVNENVSGNFRSFDYGLLIGTGMMVRLYDDFDFMVSMRGSAGLFKIEDQPGHRPKNYHVNISIGYIYYIGFR